MKKFIGLGLVSLVALLSAGSFVLAKPAVAAPEGQLSVFFRAAASPAPQNIHAGQKQFLLGRFVVMAGLAFPVTVSSMNLGSDFATSATGLQNITIYDENGKNLGSIHQVIVSGKVTNTVNLFPLTIPAGGQGKQISIRADIPSTARGPVNISLTGVGIATANTQLITSLPIKSFALTVVQ